MLQYYILFLALQIDLFNIFSINNGYLDEMVLQCGFSYFFIVG